MDYDEIRSRTGGFLRDAAAKAKAVAGNIPGWSSSAVDSFNTAAGKAKTWIGDTASNAAETVSDTAKSGLRMAQDAMAKPAEQTLRTGPASVAGDIGDTIGQVAKESGVTPGEALPENLRTGPGIYDTVDQAKNGFTPEQPAQTNTPRAGSSTPKLSPEDAAKARAPQFTNSAIPEAGGTAADTAKTAAKKGLLRRAGGYIGDKIFNGTMGTLKVLAGPTVQGTGLALHSGNAGAEPGTTTVGNGVKINEFGAGHEATPEEAAYYKQRMTPGASTLDISKIPPPPLAQQQVQAGSVGGQSQFPIQTNQGDQSPQQVINGTAVPVAGQGAFQRNGGQAQGIRGSGRPVSALQTAPQRGDELAPLRAVSRSTMNAPAATRGVGALAALGAYGALNRMKQNAANIGLRQQQIQTTAALANAEHQRAQANTDREFENKTEGQAREMRAKLNAERAQVLEGNQQTSTLGMGGETPDQYKQRLGKKAADIETQMQTSAANRKDGRKLDQMNPTEVQQLHRAYDTKQKYEKGRSGLWEQAVSYFGNKQSDSKDLYGYIPASVEPSAKIGEGWRVNMANGNSIGIKALAGGGFVLLGANEPVDADMMEQITPLIQQYKAKQGR